MGSPAPAAPAAPAAAGLQARVVTGAAPAPCAQGELPEGIPGLDTKLGLSRMLGKKSLYVAMLRRYVAGQGTVAAEIRQALAAGDRPTAERLAHTTKAVSGTIGATLVQDRAAELESALRDSGRAEDVDQQVDQLEAPLRELLDALNDHLSCEELPA